MGLNFPLPRTAAAHGPYRLVPPTGTKGLYLYQFVPPTGTNGLRFPPFRLLKMSIGPGFNINRYQCRPLIPVGAINRDQISGYIIPCLRARRSHLAICNRAVEDDADDDTDAVRLPDFAPAVADDFALRSSTDAAAPFSASPFPLPTPPLPGPPGRPLFSRRAPPRRRRPHRAPLLIYVAGASRSPVSQDLAAGR